MLLAVLLFAAVTSCRSPPKDMFEVLGRTLGSQDSGGGSKCAGCVIFSGLVEQLAVVHETSIGAQMERFCKILPKPLDAWCEDLVDDYGAVLLEMLEKKETPDAACRAAKVCTLETCRLFPPPSDLARERVHVESAMLRFEAGRLARKQKREARLEAPWTWLLHKLEQTFNNHVPIVDFDNDTFSTVREFRGYSWRGRDCDDFNSEVRPGRRVRDSDAQRDHNCNGIHGVDPATNKPWEEILCDGTPQYGTAVFGDSAAAHFHIPPDYLNTTAIGDETYRDLLKILSNEFDWPMMSAYTGHETPGWHGQPEGPVYSIYSAYRERNLCMHRDYQSIAVNGARVHSMVGPNGILRSFRRDPVKDYPMIVEYALIGNDVCDHQHTVSHETTVRDFRAAVIQSMDELQLVLPKGSHVNLYGLANGEPLYAAMHARIHPLGALRQDVTYRNVYDFLNCLDINPCWGWLNSNATVRSETTAHAALLSGVYQEIVANKTATSRWPSFEVHYYALDFQRVIDVWGAQGGQTWELIEPVDGFHNAQPSEGILARVHLNETNFLPPINPKNDQIRQLFKDQGGY